MNLLMSNCIHRTSNQQNLVHISYRSFPVPSGDSCGDCLLYNDNYNYDLNNDDHLDNYYDNDLDDNDYNDVDFDEDENLDDDDYDDIDLHDLFHLIHFDFDLNFNLWRLGTSGCCCCGFNG